MTKANIVLSVAGGVLLLIIVLGFVWLWFVSRARDSRAGADELVVRLMKRKSTAMVNIRDGVEQGDCARAERGVAELRRIGAASDWHLSDQRYSQLSDQFRRALDELSQTLAARDTQQASSAYTVLAESCLACHQQISHAQLDPAPLMLRDPPAAR